MEIEIEGKTLLRWILALILVASAVFVGLHERDKAESLLKKVEAAVLHRAGGSGVAETTRSKGGEGSSGRTLQASASPTPVVFGAPGKPTVVFEDLSTKWDWDVNEECMPKLLDWLRQDKWLKGKDIEKLVVGLVDEKAPEKLRVGPKGQEYNLIYGAALPINPPDGEYEYGSLSACIQKGLEVRCYVAPKMWKEDNAALSATVTAAYLSAIEELLRPRTKEAWNEYSTHWSIKNYEPLIKEDEGKWRSMCLTIRPSE